MNYKTELNGWATEMAIKAKAANMTIPEVISATKELVEFAYTPRKDLEGTAKDLFEMVRNAPANESKIDALIGTLEHIKEQRLAQGIDKLDIGMENPQ
jgi:hypothetical protein